MSIAATSVTSYDTLSILIAAPAFVLILQKYIEVRASYSPPTADEIIEVERKSGKKSAQVVRNIPRWRIVILGIAILLAGLFGLYKTEPPGWIALTGLLMCAIALSFLVNWRIIYKM
jgi:hypothetical protein